MRIAPALRRYSEAEIADLCRKGLAYVDDDCVLPTISGGMTLPPMSNTFEGGTDTVAITTGNSGGASGTAFDNITDTGGFLKFDSSPAYDTLSANAAPGATSQACTTDWRSLGNITGDIYFRSYHFITSLGAANTSIFRTENSAAAQCLSVFVITSGILRATDSATGTLGSYTVNPNSAAWFRIEVKINQSSGTWELRLYNNPESMTPAATPISGTGASLNTGGIDRVRFGCGTATTGYDFNWDNIAVSTVDWIGPTGQGQVPRRFPTRMPMGV